MKRILCSAILDCPQRSAVNRFLHQSVLRGVMFTSSRSCARHFSISRTRERRLLAYAGEARDIETLIREESGDMLNNSV